ncbi:L,D-transpeptidase family protein [Lysobacter soyae]|uniref:L,D-transpeptidase family protein n=1 Tax=Lysobacter soyae TaxID=2764185 RepID=A0ABX8WSE0_9GAMM|nr:L,D-transpeptidase family protein [Lysobacter sp. CJ11]QYR53763.1 L,D-transpeptidase family protein [Lysobacter sp. CJ11]
MKRLLYPLLFASVALMSGCAANPSTKAVHNAASATQLVRVLVKDWDATHGQLQRFEKHHGQWRPVGAPVEVVVGRTGSAWGRGLEDVVADAVSPVKREGDGKAPAGVFRIGTAFGYATQLDTRLIYLPMQASNYCMDVPASPLYNRIVDANKVGESAVLGSTEPMRLDLIKPGDMRYQRGFVIEHNADAVPGKGSCIFAHQWKNRDTPTAGCTAMAPEDMQTLIAWLDRRENPVFVLMPENAYQAYAASLALPAMENGIE